MRAVNPRPVTRLDTSTMTAVERQQAIAEAAGRHPSGKYQARKIEPSSAPCRCHTCGWVDTSSDRGQAMDRHVDREHGGVGRSSMVLEEGQG